PRGQPSRQIQGASTPDPYGTRINQRGGVEMQEKTSHEAHDMHHHDHDAHEHKPAHADHAGHGHAHGVDHTSHELMFRNRFWVSLALTIPVLLFSPMIQEWFGF